MQRLAELWTNEYFEYIKNKCLGAVSHLSFESFSESLNSSPPKNLKVEYCNTIKIILYNFVIIFYKNLFKIKK